MILTQNSKNILVEFLEEIKKKENINSLIRENNPCFEQVSEKSFSEKKYRYLLHGATNIYEVNEIEKWMHYYPQLSNTAKELASKIIKCWREWIRNEDQYYSDHQEYDLVEPLESEILFDYIVRYVKLAENFEEKDRLMWRALKSFLAYLRNLCNEEIAFIEQVFPKKMDIYFGSVIRKIQPEVYPISQKVASDIILMLIENCINCRPNACMSYLESLAYIWVCLTASRLRLPTNLELVRTLEFSDVVLEGEFSSMKVPTLFGKIQINISKRIAKFLLSLSSITGENSTKVLKKDRRVLDRTLEKVVKELNLSPDIGKISFITFLSHPHHGPDNYRTKPKN